MRDEEVKRICNEYCGDEMVVLKKICLPIILQYGGITESEHDEFYSIANETVWRAAVMFNDNINDSFDKYLRECLSNRFKSVMTKKNRKKRIPIQVTVNIDSPITSDSSKTYADVLDSGYDLEKEVEGLQDDGLDLFMEKLSRKQKRICELIIQGYKKEEIIKIMDISARRFDTCLDALRNYETRILLSGEYDRR